jgi:hypothetical protein
MIKEAISSKAMDLLNTDMPKIVSRHLAEGTLARAGQARYEQQSAEVAKTLSQKKISPRTALGMRSVYTKEGSVMNLETNVFNKLAKAFTSQHRPAKVKEIYNALKREHPEYSAGKKARIANSAYDKMASWATSPARTSFISKSNRALAGMTNSVAPTVQAQILKLDSSSALGKIVKRPKSPSMNVMENTAALHKMKTMLYDVDELIARGGRRGIRAWPTTKFINTDVSVVSGYDKIGFVKTFSKEEAKKIGDKLGVDWTEIPLDQFRLGLGVELEHGSRYPEANLTDDCYCATGKIAWAHLKEFKDYYTRLDKAGL